ncbi:MAG: hypothetical protein M3N47_03185 [Chloroflexota bacterium]|nr:hypothetical protein [Chloroflexota bacterium]
MLVGLAVATSLAVLVRLPARRSGAGDPSAYLQEAARRIDAVLERRDAAVPFYAFGHTHVPDRTSLSVSATPAYVNAGTWRSSMPEQHPFLRIRRRPGGPPEAELLAWHDVRGTEAALAER